MLHTLTSDTVIDVLKQTFSRHGTPVELVSDNGPQYKAKTFKQFMNSWNVKHTTSSPQYPKSNGLEEYMVKCAKRTIKKCVRSVQDIYMGLLILRNSPLNYGYISYIKKMEPPHKKWKGDIVLLCLLTYILRISVSRISASILKCSCKQRREVTMLSWPTT